jgi:hypothetical protein
VFRKPRREARFVVTAGGGSIVLGTQVLIGPTTAFHEDARFALVGLLLGLVLAAVLLYLLWKAERWDNPRVRLRGWLRCLVVHGNHDPRREAVVGGFRCGRCGEFGWTLDELDMGPGHVGLDRRSRDGGAHESYTRDRTANARSGFAE